MKTNQQRTKKQWALFIAGLIAVITGISILGFFGIRKICREYKKAKLMRENAVVEIEALHIKAPILEGTDNDVLSKAAGHFPDTGSIGSGNYCIAAHSSVLYKEYFNHLKDAEIGMQICLYTPQKECFSYEITDIFIVEPNNVQILNDFADDRVTLVTCTDDGTQRLVAVGKLQPNVSS